MTQIAHYVDAPFQGVSQAPASVRNDGQAQAIEDTFLSVPSGASKRPPFSWMARFGSHPGSTNGLFEVIERLGQADQFLTVTNEAGVIVPRLYSAQGLPRGYEPQGFASPAIVISAAAQAYLNTGNPTPITDLVAVTVEDYTFLLNRKAVVGKQMSGGVPAVSPSRPFEGMVWVRLAAYARTFTITVTPKGGTPVTSTLHTPNGSAAADARWVDTDVIASTLYSAGGYTTADEGSASTTKLTDLTSQGFTVALLGPVIYLSHPTIDFTIDVADGQGGTAMTAIKDKVARFSDLPIKAIANFTVRITQSTTATSDDFYVTYTPTAGTGTGIWQETIAPGAELGLDPATMPVGLYQGVDGVWRVDVLAWKPRKTGDQVLAPDPDFVGSTLTDLTFWRGRLVLLSAEAVSLSSAIDPFRFYPDTLSTVEDGDTLSFLSPSPQRSTFHYVVPYEDRLLAYGDTAQAQVTSQGALAFATARIDNLTTFEFDSGIRPFLSNGKVYFIAPHGLGGTTVYELKTDRQTNVTGGEDMTGSIPTYLPAGLDRVASCPVNYLAVYGKGGTSRLFAHVFRYTDTGNGFPQRVQNAWSAWNLPAPWVLGGMLFRNTRLYLLACHPSGEAHLLMANVTPGLVDDGMGARILTRLDFRVGPSQVVRQYNRATDLSSIALPFPVLGSITLARASVQAPGGPGGETYGGALSVQPEGFGVAGVTSTAMDHVISIPGDWTQAPMWFGLAYTQRITLSRFYALGSDNRPLRSGRLSIRRCRADLAETGYMRAEVQAGARALSTAEFTGYTADDPASGFDVAPVATSVFNFLVFAQNETVTLSLVNDSHLPSTYVGLEWIGEINVRAAR